MTYLVDTNTLSELAKPTPDSRVLDWFGQANEAELFLSVLTVGEIAKGVARLPPGKKRTDLDAWLRVMRTQFGDRVLPVDVEVANLWGRMSGEAVTRGQPIPVVDALVAATARRHDLTVVTRNVKDFEMAEVPVYNPWDEHRSK